MSTNRHQRRRAASLTATDQGASVVGRPPGGTVLDRATNDQAYHLGFEVGRRGQQVLDQVLFVSGDIHRLILAISDVVVVTEGLPVNWQAERLRVHFVKMAPDGVDKLLLNLTYDLRRSIDAFLPFAEGGIEHYFNREETSRLETLAAHFATGVYNLVAPESPNHDDGESLHAAMLEHGKEQVDAMLDMMRAKASTYGRSPGTDDVTRAIGEYAQGKVPEWGQKWTLIGKRHFAELDRLDRPNEIEQKVLARYKKVGYLDRQGQWHGQPNALLTLVRNAFRAVGG